MSVKDKLPVRREIDIQRPVPFPDGAVLCRLIDADFEDAAITLRALARHLPPLASGNYVVQRQQDWCAMRDSASGMSTGTAKTPKAVEGRSPASPVAESETPPPSDLSTDKDG